MIARNAYEVGGYYPNGLPYPHLKGHPNITIFHWFEIGGYQGGYTAGPGTSIYYADSATSVWTSVPQFSWYDAWTLVVILGGRGYIW